MTRKNPTHQDISYPWERQPGETPAQFAAFVTYRDIPAMERSAQRVASELGRTAKPATIHNWRTRNGWFERVQAWDDEQDRVKREQMLKRSIKEADRVANTAADFQKLFSVPVREFMRRYQSDDVMVRTQLQDEIQLLTVAQLLQLATITARPFAQMWEAQQQAYGVSTQHLVVQTNVASPNDPFKTDDQYFARVVLAWQESGLLPKLKAGEQAQLEQKAGDP